MTVLGGGVPTSGADKNDCQPPFVWRYGFAGRQQAPQSQHMIAPQHVIVISGLFAQVAEQHGPMPSSGTLGEAAPLPALERTPATGSGLLSVSAHAFASGTLSPNMRFTSSLLMGVTTMLNTIDRPSLPTLSSISTEGLNLLRMLVVEISLGRKVISGVPRVDHDPSGTF